MKIFLLIFYIISNQNLDSIFQRSNEFYTNGEYNLAIEGYEEILKYGFESSELYFNLANSYYKLNNIPETNFYFEKAKSISPNDEDILVNLSYAQNLRIDKIEKLPVSQIQSFKIKSLNLFSEKCWSILFIVFIWLSSITFGCYILIKNSNLKRLFFSSSIVLLLIGGFLLIVNMEKKLLLNEEFAIIFNKEVEVWSEPNKISELKFLLHEGTKVKKIDTIQDWVNIQLENGTIGWIQSSSIRILD
ncbi:MAG: GW dipeptide domain-containing protein [Bacteroidota bacterium]